MIIEKKRKFDIMKIHEGANREDEKIDDVKAQNLIIIYVLQISVI